jgi:hypothetical protein
MADKPSIDRFLFDLLERLRTLPYAREHIDTSKEHQITVHCSDGSLVMRFEELPPGIL